jgi:hypothetical protein
VDRRLLAVPAATATLLVITCCSGPPASDTSANSSLTTSTTTPQLVTSGGPSGDGPGQEICKVTSNTGGVFYLNVTSKTANDLSACDGDTAIQGDLDYLFSIPHMDRRCVLPTAGEPDAQANAYNAIVGVYSDTTEPNLDAANAYCQANAGTNS